MDAWAVLLGRILQNFNGFLLSIIIVKRFGLAAVGSLTIASTATVILGTLCTFGLPYVFAHSQAPLSIRNSVGLASSVCAIVFSVPFCIMLGLLFGRDNEEAIVVFLLAMAGPYFAQTMVANSLLVLQGRSADILLSPAGNLLGLIAGYVVTDDLLTFSLILAISRFAGGFAAFSRLRMGRVSIGTLTAHLRKGVHFLTADTVSLVADQASLMAASALLSRESLGLFGLCRQLLTVSDTPGTSSIVVWYPRACQSPRDTFPALQRHMLSLGIVCAVVLAALSIPLGLWIYHLPSFLWLAPLLLLCVPFRYLVGTYETTLRALNSIGGIRNLTLVPCILAVFLPIGIRVADVCGGIIAIIVQRMITAFLSKLMVNRELGVAKAGKSNPVFAIVGNAAPQESH